MGSTFLSGRAVAGIFTEVFSKMAADDWRTVALASDLPSMSMKEIIVDGREIALINWNGNYYAIGNRCGHMNSPLSRGQLKSAQSKEIVVCPLHGSTFDITTGKLLSGPVKPPPVDMSCLPKAAQDSIAKAAELSASIKVHDVESYQVERQGDEIKLKIV